MGGGGGVGVAGRFWGGGGGVGTKGKISRFQMSRGWHLCIRGQLIEKCQDQKLRRKFLEKPNATLADLQDIPRAFEAVNEQKKSMDKSSVHPTGQVN